MFSSRLWDWVPSEERRSWMYVLDAQKLNLKLGLENKNIITSFIWFHGQLSVQFFWGWKKDEVREESIEGGVFLHQAQIKEDENLHMLVIDHPENQHSSQLRLFQRGGRLQGRHLQRGIRVHFWILGTADFQGQNTSTQILQENYLTARPRRTSPGRYGRYWNHCPIAGFDLRLQGATWGGSGERECATKRSRTDPGGFHRVWEARGGNLQWSIQGPGKQNWFFMRSQDPKQATTERRELTLKPVTLN